MDNFKKLHELIDQMRDDTKNMILTAKRIEIALYIGFGIVAGLILLQIW